MFSVVKKALDQAKRIQENHINQINEFVEINKTNNELRQREEAGEFISKNLYKDAKSVFEGDIITREFKNNTISLAKMLLPYSSVKLELISKNVEGNNVSDVDNASMLTYLNNIFNDEELLNNYAEVIFKNSQYIKSNFLLEQRDGKGNIIHAGVFKYDSNTGKYKATSYAKKMFKASKVAGASYIDNGSNVLYNAMADFDYIVSSYIAFQKCIDTDTNEETTKLANYFIRIPSDAQNSYFITAPRYDTRDLLGTAEESEEFKNAYGQAIIEAKLNEPADIKDAVDLKTNNDKFNDIVTGKIDSINLYDKRIQNLYAGQTKKIQLINKEGLKYVVEGKIVNINNTNSYAITNIKRVGTYFDNKTADSNENLNKLKNIIKRDLISTGSFTTVNRNSKIFTQFRNVFEQELINMAMNIDAIFRTDKGDHEGMVQMIDRDVFDYNDNFLNDDRELKFYEVYHKRTNKYKLKDGTTATHKTLVQPVYNKVTDENGKEYYEIATDENGNTKYKLSGRCFESDRFTVYTDEGYRNFGQEVIDNYFDLLGANNFLGYTKDANGKIVLKLSDEQNQAIDNAIDEFIKALVKSNRDRLINPLKYAKNTDNSFDSIVNYSINYQLMYYNFCDILEGDSKFYKDSQTFLKRAKEMIAGGKPYGIFDLNRFEEHAPEDIDDAKLSNTEFVKIDSEGNKTPYSIKARTGFYGVTITNSIKTSENATKDNDDPNSLFSKLKDDYEKLGFSPEDARTNANKILDLYQDTKVNDAQSYITFEEFVRRIAAKGQLNRYKPLIDKILDESTPINPDELKEFVQLQKNFYYDLHYDELFNLRRPRQIKNAEFVLIPRFIKGTDLENVYNIMTKFGIDQLNTSETSKAGKNYILDIFDNEGALLSDVKEDLINNTNNSKFFKHAPFAREIYPYNFLYCQLETPQHIKNSLNKFAIQIAKKVFDNITNKNKKLYPIKQRFFKLYGEKIERCANKVFRDLNILDENNLIKLNEYGRLDGLNYEVLLDKFEAELFRTGFDENLLDYVTISESTKLSEVLGAYPKTVMPMSTNIVAPKLESVSQSIMNNSVTRQKIRGYHGGQVTSVGFGNSKAPWELDITSLKKSPSFNEFISKNPNLKSKTQEQRDAYIDNNINKVREDYRKYLTKNNKNFALYSDRLKYHPNGENYVEVLVPRTAVNVNWFDDKGNKKSDEAVLKEIQEAGVDEHIIYRIPTEGKGSICVAKIKGFIDESLGSTIVVPDDWVSQTGSDFDIDSVYSICYKTYIDKNTNTLKKVDYKDNKDINENDWYKYINRELKKLEEDIIPNTLHSDIKTEIANRKEKVDELNSNYSEYNEKLNDAFLKCSKPIRGLIINASKRTAAGNSKREELIDRLTNIINNLKTTVINKKVKGFEDAINYVEAAQKMIDYLNDSPNVKNEYYENTNSAIITLKAENHAKFNKAAQKYNLASYEEFKNNYYKYASDDAIENGITSCIINIMKDDSVRIENLSPSNFKAIIDARDELMNKVVKEKRNARSPFNILDQAEYHGDAISGMSLKALSVVRDNFCSICNTVEPKLTPSNQVKVFYSKDRYNIDSIVRNFSDENGTNIEVTDKGVYVTHDRLGWSNNSLNIENMIFTSYSAQTTAHILDNIKEGNIPNVNIYTFQVYKTFPDLGIDYRTCISFMMHPAVEDIVNFYNINNSVFNDSRFNRPIYDTYIKLANEINRYFIDNKKHLPVIQVNNIKQDALKDSIEAALVALGKSYDEISTQKEVFSVEKNLAGVNNEFDDIADYFVNYYSTIHQFERLYNTSNKINALTRVLNPDKFGAKKSIFETNQVFESINEIINSEDEPVLTVDGANILEAIYPGIERGYSTEQMINKFLTSDKRDSKYPPLYYFLKYATAPSIKISQAIFPTQSIEFREVVNTLNDILPASARISYKLNNNFERYITNCIYRNCKISKSNFIVLRENNDFNISYDITSEHTLTPQQNISAFYSEDGKTPITIYRGYALKEDREASTLEETIGHTAVDYDDTLKGAIYFTSSKEEAEDYAKGRTDKSPEFPTQENPQGRPINRHYTGDYAKVSKYYITANAKVEHYADMKDYVRNGKNSTADVIILDKGTLWTDNTEYIVRNPSVVIQQVQQQPQQQEIQNISSKTAAYSVVIDPNLKDSYVQWQRGIPKGIVAYRVNYNKYNTPEEASAGRIGNPFSENTRDKDTVQQFYDWLVTGNNFGNNKATEKYRQAIINKIMNTPNGSPILYYKELGRPSHATVLGYLISNKQLLQQPTQQSVSDSRENMIVDVISGEEQRIYGFNRPNSVAIQKEDVDYKGETKRFISPFEISDINNPTNEELNDYVKLTPAQKIAWIKSYFTNPGVFDVFEVNLKNSYKTKYNSINSQLIYFNDSTIDVQSVRNELYKLSKSSNPLIKLAVLDLVKYAFVVEGFTMRKNGVSKAISNKILTDNEMLYNENSIIDDFNSSFDNIVSYYSQSKDIAESFLRGSYNDIPSVPKRSVPKVSSVTKFQDISSMNTELKNILENTDRQKGILDAYNMSHPKSIKNSFDDLTDEDKLKTLGYTNQLLFGANRDVFVDSRDETIIEKYNLDTAPYIVLTVDKKQLLYKVNILSNGDYYLYPLNKLEKNENNKFSINPDNNTRNVLSKEYYELKKEALDCNGPLPEINNSYIYQKPEPIINSKSVTYEDIKNDEIKNETWNTIIKKFEDSKSTYIKNYDNEKMQKSPFRINSKVIPEAYYFMNNSMHFGRINIIDDGKNKYKVIKIKAKTFKDSVIKAKDEFDKQVIEYEKHTGKVTGTFRKFLQSYNPSYEQLVYNDFVIFPNTPEVYCMTDYSSETSSNSAIGEDTSIIEGVKRNAKAVYDSIIGNSPVERNNKYTLTDYFTDAYLQMVNNSREKNDEIATEIKNELNSHGIIGQATAINKNLLIASEYTATYAVRRFEDFVDRINHFELIDDSFVPATDPRIMDMCKNDSKLRNKVLKLIEDIVIANNKQA